ncbi:MAG TPA: hypothetical protein ENK78_09710 [Thiothrix sp.]|nr:hypothetical protein [Thiothrix sp.]
MLPSIQYLVNQFGVSKAARMLAFALPYVREHKQNLYDALNKQDFALASACAHKALSPVRLYGTPTLEQLLLHIKDYESHPQTLNNVSEDVEQLQQSVMKEFDEVIEQIEQWMEQVQASV